MCLHVSTTFSIFFYLIIISFTVPYFIGHVIDKQKTFKACKLPNSRVTVIVIYNITYSA